VPGQHEVPLSATIERGRIRADQGEPWEYRREKLDSPTLASIAITGTSGSRQRHSQRVVGSATILAVRGYFSNAANWPQPGTSSPPATFRYVKVSCDHAEAS
jgi:hypothetical protein